MKHTKHSIKRKSQRGITDFQLSLLEKEGSIKRAPGGIEKLVLRKKDAQDAISMRKKEIQALSKISGLTVIKDGQTILTVYRKY